jgi:HAD superfamily hydrolase (TIGR01549 family)
MSRSGIKAVIFDLGNVLIDFDYRIAVNRILQFTDKSPKQIFELFFDSQLTALFEEGKISPNDFFLRVKEMLNLKLDYESFLPIWNEIFFLSPKNEQVYNLAMALKKNYSLALISNIDVLHLDYIKKKFSAFDHFDNIIASCEIQVRKPEPLIYQKTLDALGVLPQNTFYTDDRPELVESANRLGLKGFVFKGIVQLNKDLIAAGVSLN